jgi:hypothetical protein
MPLPPPRCPTAQGAATSSLELRRSEPELSAVPSRVPGEQFPPTPSCRALIVRRGRWSPASLPRRGPQALPRDEDAAGRRLTRRAVRSRAPLAISAGDEFPSSRAVHQSVVVYRARALLLHPPVAKPDAGGRGAELQTRRRCRPMPPRAPPPPTTSAQPHRAQPPRHCLLAGNWPSVAHR